ncbi:hypothetical protein EsH8_III_000279 [Colletotrichum jinshuiense]
MESIAFNWFDEDCAISCATPELPTSDSPRDGLAAEQPNSTAERVDSIAEQIDQPSGDRALPLLRLSDWDRTKQYDKNNPECIHYDFRWKVSQRERIRARQVCSDTDPDLVLAPSDFWEVNFKTRLETLLEDKGKFSGDEYTCEETIIDISIERSRQRGLKKRFKGLEIDWNMVDEHMKGLGPLFSKRRKITFSMEIVCKEVTGDSTTAKGKRKKQTATEAQKVQRAAEAGLWTRVYEHYRCRGTHCKQGPHCWPDERGNHHRLLPRHLEEIVRHMQGNMREGDNEDEVDVNIEIPSKILGNILNDSRKRKAEDSVDCRSCKARGRYCDTGEDLRDVVGDRKEKLEEYSNWTMAQVEDGGWRAALQVVIDVALAEYLDLNTMMQHPKDIVALLASCGVKLGIAWQFVSNIRTFQQETKKS